MKVLIVDQDGVGLAFAARCAKAGHQVRYFIKPSDSNNQAIGDGFKGIEKIKNWLGSAKWADLAWCTGNSDYIEKLDMVRRSGVSVYAPNAASARLEIERGYGMKFLEQHGIEVPEYKVFKGLKEAEDHVWKHEDRFVFKTLGDNEDKSLSYCAKTPADLIACLQQWQRQGMNPKGPVMLQKFIPGVEFAVSRWMGAQGFIGKYNENFEHKKLLSGNYGPNCGESGTVQAYVEDSQLAEDVLAPLEKPLVEMGHLGDIDVNCIVDENGKAWPLEFTCRPGWPAFNIMLAEHRGDPVEWMLDACKGKDTLQATTAIACGIVVGQPDYPHSNFTKKQTEGIPVYGVSEKNHKYIYPQQVKMQRLPTMDGGKVVEKEMWATCGDYLAVVTGTGKNIKTACERAYSTVKELHIKDLMCRDDVGQKLQDELPKLQAFGYATHFEYE